MIKQFLISRKYKTEEVLTPYKLFSWGYNGNGQLGINNTTDQSSPNQVGSLTVWAKIDVGDYYMASVRDNNTLWTWGDNTYGELGQNDTTARSSPTQMGSLTTWKSVACGNNHTLALKTDGTLWAWGYNGNGELGQNNNTNYSSAVQIGSATNWSKISAGANHCLAIKEDGTLWAWGANTAGETGHLTGYGIGVNGILTPTQVGSLTTWAEVSAGAYYSLAIKTDGTLWAWGDNQDGNLGTNNTTDYSSPVQSGAASNWKKVSTSLNGYGVYHVLGIKTDGTLWAWGNGDYGQIGDGDFIYYSSAVQIGTDTDWDDIAAGSGYSLAVKTNGTLWSWGYNEYGMLGDGSSGFSYTTFPTQVGALTSWKKVAAGYYSSHALRT